MFPTPLNIIFRIVSGCLIILLSKLSIITPLLNECNCDCTISKSNSSEIPIRVGLLSTFAFAEPFELSVATDSFFALSFFFSAFSFFSFFSFPLEPLPLTLELLSELFFSFFDSFALDFFCGFFFLPLKSSSTFRWRKSYSSDRRINYKSLIGNKSNIYKGYHNLVEFSNQFPMQHWKTLHLWFAGLLLLLM